MGAGGTAIALPALVYVVGVEAHGAVALSLLLVGGASVFGAALHHRKGLVRWRAALAFAPAGIVGAVAGSRVSYLLSGRALLLAFSVLLVVIAWRILREQGIEQARRRAWPVTAGAGLGIGVITGMLGVGGGFVIVPALVWGAGLAFREAVATSLVVIAANSAAAFAGHALREAPPAGLALVLLGAAASGMKAGVHLSHRTDPARLKRYFAFLLLGLAAFMFTRNLAG
jgi:uncharacterized protein